MVFKALARIVERDGILRLLEPPIVLHAHRVTLLVPILLQVVPYVLQERAAQEGQVLVVHALRESIHRLLGSTTARHALQARPPKEAMERPLALRVFLVPPRPPLAPLRAPRAQREHTRPATDRQCALLALRVLTKVKPARPVASHAATGSTLTLPAPLLALPAIKVMLANPNLARLSA